MIANHDEEFIPGNWYNVKSVKELHLNEGVFRVEEYLLVTEKGGL